MLQGRCTRDGLEEQSRIVLEGLYLFFAVKWILAEIARQMEVFQDQLGERLGFYRSQFLCKARLISEVTDGLAGLRDFCHAKVTGGGLYLFWRVVFRNIMPERIDAVMTADGIFDVVVWYDIG